MQTIVSNALEPLRDAVMHPDAKSYQQFKEWDKFTIREFFRDKLCAILFPAAITVRPNMSLQGPRLSYRSLAGRHR